MITKRCIVYISYVKDDEVVALEIASRLSKYHIDYFLGKESASGKEKIFNIQNMKVLVFLFSQCSINSNIVDNEITAAVENQVPIVPFQIDNSYIRDNLSLDFMLKKSQWVLGYPNREKQMDNLIVSVCRFLGIDAIQENPTDPFEQLKRGVALEYGTNGLLKDRKMAMLWLEKSAESGNLMAMYELYKFYVNSEDDNEFTDYDKAKAYLIMAADNGLSEAQYKLGTNYEVYDENMREIFLSLSTNVSLPLRITKDINKAIYYYELASNQGHKKAKERLDYLKSEDNTASKTITSDDVVDYYCQAQSFANKHDTINTFYSMAEAAAGGLPIAMYYLSRMFIKGIGTYVDYTLAAKWLMKADIPGLPDATNLLGKLYASGKGVEKDMKKAKDCFKRAAIQYNTITEYNKVVNKKDQIDI